MFFLKKFLNRMMEFQAKFCHPSELRLWRTGVLLSTNSKGHKSNAIIWGTYWMPKKFFEFMRTYSKLHSFYSTLPWVTLYSAFIKYSNRYILASFMRGSVHFWCKKRLSALHWTQANSACYVFLNESDSNLKNNYQIVTLSQTFWWNMFVDLLKTKWLVLE